MTKRVLLLTSKTCAPCRQIKAHLAEIKKEHENFEYSLIEHGEPHAEGFFKTFAVRNVPVVIIAELKESMVGMYLIETDRISGGQTKETLIKKLKEGGVL